jgi:hypothetical protein
MEELAPLASAFEPRVEPAIVRWAQLTTWQRRFVTLDDLAAHAGLTQGEFFGAIARASFEYTGTLADLIVASAVPEMMVAATKRACTPQGFEDRWMLLQHAWSWPRSGKEPTTPPEGKTLEDVIHAAPVDDPPSAA